jgi:hypothetical protein
MMPKGRGMTFFKTGAWILTIAGFAHALIAVSDTWILGAFSPVDGTAVKHLKTTTLGIAAFMHGDGTSVFDSAWGAYIGFAIAVGILTAFLGLLFIMISKDVVLLDRRFSVVPLLAVIVSGVMTVIGIFFYFFFPTLILSAGFICFLLAYLLIKKEAVYAAR